MHLQTNTDAVVQEAKVQRASENRTTTNNYYSTNNNYFSTQPDVQHRDKLYGLNIKLTACTTVRKEQKYPYSDKTSQNSDKTSQILCNHMWCTKSDAQFCIFIALLWVFWS